ncbi:unnamed protein product [Eruca vesicaria subsp. sativa]|uniref:Uncharacterized protein n=1 Tax=Eruca vesicaria subsp. sativa TaxID=29727 RepID=A0ABC8M7Z6_ERUVS|nr:unnamed protein product [Eruca vesicaria subsp. sativa]
MMADVTVRVRLVFQMDEFVLPPFESSCVLKDKDIVWLDSIHTPLESSRIMGVMRKETTRCGQTSCFTLSFRYKNLYEALVIFNTGHLVSIKPERQKQQDAQSFCNKYPEFSA